MSSSDAAQLEMLGPSGEPRSTEDGDLVHDVHFGDNLDVLADLPSDSADPIYIDPPFNTGQVREHTRLRMSSDEEGAREGFGGQTYRVEEGETMAYPDRSVPVERW